MPDVQTTAYAAARNPIPKQLDALVIGAGVAGLYQLHQLREMGLRAHACDTASDVGGTWYWNRYPGAKFDSEAYIYQYLFDEKLYKDWTWSERFPSQPEIERYCNHVADKFDLRRDIQFSARVQTAAYDAAAHCWEIGLEDGSRHRTRFRVPTIRCGR